MKHSKRSSEAVAHELDDWAQRFPLPDQMRECVVEAARRLRHHRAEVERLERSRDDLRRFREQAFFDHWMRGKVEMLIRSNATLGQEIAGLKRSRATGEGTETG